MDAQDIFNELMDYLDKKTPQIMQYGRLHSERYRIIEERLIKMEEDEGMHYLLYGRNEIHLTKAQHELFLQYVECYVLKLSMEYAFLYLFGRWDKDKWRSLKEEMSKFFNEENT